MSKYVLKETAERYGYHGELLDFLDYMELEGYLFGVGVDTVLEAIKNRLPQNEIVKIAFAREGCFFAETEIEGDDWKGEDETTLDEWAAQGEEEFKKHCDKAGHFRFNDFMQKI